uniref:Uncoupling protein 3 n=1 Tax=Naja naja TaxID=35670 RepID=A0A8C6XEW5_NAJNA
TKISGLDQSQDDSHTTSDFSSQIQGESRTCKASRQVKYKGVLGTISTMVKMEGPKSLYKGLVAGLQRQMSFASVRIGLYDSVKELYTPKGSEHTSIFTRLLAGCTTGAMAVTCAQPTDVVKVRFQAHIQLVGAPKRYNGTVDAYRTIAREEGVRGLWKGTFPNITRNAIVNCGEMKEHLLSKFLMPIILRVFSSLVVSPDNFPCHFVAAFGAGFCATVVASPVDVVKTRYMNSSAGQYKNALSCMLTMVVKEGPNAFYKGFIPSFLRLGSWNVVMFVSYEQLKRLMVLAQVSWEAPF